MSGCKLVDQKELFCLSTWDMKCLWTASINCSLDGLGLASCLAIAELNIIGTVDSRPLIWESKLYLRDWSGANISTAQSVLACSGQLSAEFTINTSAKMQRYKLQKQCGANIVEQWLRLKLHWGIDIDYCGMIVGFQPNDFKHKTQGSKSHTVWALEAEETDVLEWESHDIERLRDFLWNPLCCLLLDRCAFGDCASSDAARKKATL